MKRTCVFHAGCPDGFGAAWAVWRAWDGGGHYVARGHEDRLRGEDFEDHLVAFVDIAPDNDELRDLARHASQVIVLDHHITSKQRYESDHTIENQVSRDGHVVRFDMSQSGAVLAWRYFMPEEPLPDLLGYVQDQDLWSWALPESEAVNAAISSYPRTFEVWSALAERPIRELMQEGAPILRANRQDVERSLRNAAPLAIGSRRVESVNASINRSAIGHELAQRKAFGERWGCVYRIVGDRVYATLYSIGDFDVSTIAGEYGGGGHKNAAGFSVSLADWVRDFVC
jgi:hypothetical protein